MEIETEPVTIAVDQPKVERMVENLLANVARHTEDAMVWIRVAPQDGWHADRFGWAAVTIALLGVGSIRAADWLFALCAAAAVLTATLAVLRGRSMPALLSGMAATVAAAFRALPWVGQAVATRTGRSRPGITVSVGNTVISRTGREYLGSGTLGYLIFQLNGAGQSMLGHAAGNQLGAQVKVTSSQGNAVGQLALVRFG